MKLIEETRNFKTSLHFAIYLAWREFILTKILVAEDTVSIRMSLVKILEGENYEVVAVENGNQALAELDKSYFDLILTDLRLPGADGMAILSAAKKKDPTTEVIIITAFGNIDLAVEAMKKSAYDFVAKPFSLDEILLKVKKALREKSLREENRRLQTENISLKEEIGARYGECRIIGQSRKMKEVFRLIQQVAKSELSCLIRGESGTGKELVAYAIHHQSRRAKHPFIVVNCGALAEGVLESELFGHEKGAFTGAISSRLGRFELAHRGTIFLDEIGDISLSTQVKLLRVLQEKRFERVGGTRTIEVDVRIISATNKNLEAEIKAGRFREDLFYRLNVVTFSLPPLRERKEDIPLLVNFFLNQAGKADFSVAPEVLTLLQAYPWPGNIRELENVIKRAVIFVGEDKTIEPQHLPPSFFSDDRLEIPAEAERGNLQATMEAVEKQLILRALKQAGGVKAKAAAILGLDRSALHYKLKKHNIQ